MHRIHDEVTQFIGISAGLYMLHHIGKKLVSDFEVVEVVAFHTLLDCCDLDKAHADHEDLALTH